MAGSDDFIPRTELDMAQLKFEMRTMYKHVGFWKCMQILSDMLIGARTLAEIMVEERRKELN